MQAIIEVESKVLAIPEQARQITIATTEDYLKAASFLKSIKALRKEVDGVFDPMQTTAHANWKAIVEQHNKADAPLKEGETIIKREMSKYDTEQERIRAAEQQRQDEARRRQEEEERLANAIALEEQGRGREAEVVLECPAPIPVSVVAKDVPKVAGISYRDNWKFEIENLGEVPREYMTPDMVKIGAVVRALKGGTRIPGVRVYSEKTVAA